MIAFITVMSTVPMMALRSVIFMTYRTLYYIFGGSEIHLAPKEVLKPTIFGKDSPPRPPGSRAKIPNPDSIKKFQILTDPDLVHTPFQYL
jgi:hypothetical protein